MPSKRLSLWSLAAGLCALAAPGVAQQIAPLPRPAPLDAPVLQLDDLLANSARQSPQIIEALARTRAADAKRLTAEGAFDTVFSAEGGSRLVGYYGGTYADAKLARPLENWGGQIYGGYRASSGRFPIYEDKNYTNEFGEIRAGAVFSLLRDRMIDDRRFGRVTADADRAVADAERQMVAIGVQRKALDAYLNWVASGERLKVYRHLLDLAQERQRGLDRAYRAGLRPRIVLTENDQMVLRRQAMVVQSEQAMAAAANALSLYWRDSEGNPTIPRREQLPASLPDPVVTAIPHDLQRPDLLVADLKTRLVQDRLALDRNALLPRLDLNMEVARDIGDIGPGGASRSGNDVRFGIKISVPLEQRTARGKLMQTQAELDANQTRARWLDEQIRAEVDGIAIAFDAATQLIALSQQEKQRADTMAVAERRRFEMGASDLFLVNTREEAAASVALNLLDGHLKRLASSADLAASSGNAAALGL
ncbi:MULTISPECIES: TolC family protein [unclassified Novosphingobium]|uniref:TolC family protein n=1 Tax=unclassified Novosphingobium TaxID=2644732 RepID=UPI0012D1125E|nr:MULTISPECIES: TolC family protein [unclassified Novosphingobium]MPS68190.1 multidrug transporter [Novosphingobium sp.]WRT95239.1 TolC family protein [Novosphingobium sp. RL4]